ncbi:MAG: gamma-glutamyl-gamma-aminobutyrate hydrolase family protein [Pyrinomonadaceae bacterium]
MKPKIGITMRLELPTRRFYLGCDYSEALAGLGAIPFHLSLIPDKKYIAEAVKNLDGILLPGCDTDVEPLRYDEEPHPKLGRVITEKDETDLMVLEEAEKRNLPVLGICFGMQVLNVSRGGSLIQDIESQVANSLQHSQLAPLDRNSHSIEVEKESVLSSLITSKNVKVNSSHHQSVKEAGKNLKITARAKDGVVECIEDTRQNHFVLGVQWHPEVNWKTEDLSRKIFELFIEKCR